MFRAKEVTESEAPGQSVPSGFKERGGEQGDWRSAGIRELAARVVRNGKGQGGASMWGPRRGDTRREERGGQVTPPTSC